MGKQKKCCVPNCWGKDKKVFCFPNKAELAKVWITNGKMNVEEILKFTSYRRICELHFHASQFTNSNRTSLNRNAIPTIFSPPPCSLPPTLTPAPAPAAPSVPCAPPAAPTAPYPVRLFCAQPRASKPALLPSKFSVNHLSELMPHKQLVSDEIKKSKLRILTLKRKCEKMGIPSVKSVCKMDSHPEVQDLAEKLSSAHLTLLEFQLRGSIRHPADHTWTREETIVTLSLFKRSPKCYSVLRLVFPLPALRALVSLLKAVPYEPGINPHILTCLGKALYHMDPDDALCSLLFDRVSLKEQGSEHCGDGQASSAAVCALVFMLRGLRRKWKLPLAYFCSHGITARKLRTLIEEVLHACGNVGARVVATVCDMSTLNVTALQDMGASFAEPFFPFRGQIIATVYDPPHLLKSTRDLFRQNNVKWLAVDTALTGEQPVDGAVHFASWVHIRRIFDYDQQHKSFQLVRKLTATHLDPVGKSATLVSLAAEVLSHRVAAAVYCLGTRLGILGTDAVVTSAFVKGLDVLFDSLTGWAPCSKADKVYHCRVSEDSPHVVFWLAECSRLQQWEFVGTESPVLHGWLATLRASLHVWRVFRDRGVDYLEPRALNQDALDNLLSSVRTHCGPHGHSPTKVQFVEAWKTCIASGLAYRYIREPNCRDDDASLIVDLQTYLQGVECNESTVEECM